MWLCVGQSDRHEPSKDDRPVGKVTWAYSPRSLATGKTGKQDLVPRVTFPPLACHWSCGLDPLTFLITGPSSDPSSPGRLLVMLTPPWRRNQRPKSGFINSLWALVQSLPSALALRDNIQATPVFQLQAQESNRTRQAKPGLTLGPAASNGQPSLPPPLPFPSLPPPGTGQSVETTTLKRHACKADEYSIEILPWDRP